jgi:hypothetical protein
MLCGSSLLYFVVDGFLSFFLWSMSVFRLFTASDYPFDNFKLFSNWFFFVVKTPGISVVFVLPNMYVLGVMSCGSLFVFVVVLFLVSYCIVIVLLLYCYCIVIVLLLYCYCIVIVLLLYCYCIVIVLLLYCLSLTSIYHFRLLLWTCLTFIFLVVNSLLFYLSNFICHAWLAVLYIYVNTSRCHLCSEEFTVWDKFVSKQDNQSLYFSPVNKAVYSIYQCRGNIWDVFSMYTGFYVGVELVRKQTTYNKEDEFPSTYYHLVITFPVIIVYL